MEPGGKERNLGSRASPLTGLSPGGVFTCRMNSPGRSIIWQVSVESHASQQGQPEENQHGTGSAPPLANNVTCLPRVNRRYAWPARSSPSST